MNKLTIDEIDKLRPFIDIAGYHEYNSNVVTMMMWQFSYPTTYEIHEHFAVVKWHYDTESSWMMPLCEKQYRKEAIEYMRAYSENHHEDFTIASVTEEFKGWFEKEYPTSFLYENYEDAQDYVYLSEQHRMLVGKKMQKRRNHYNAFLKEYASRFEYKTLSEISDQEILHYLDVWNEKHEASASLESEKQGIQFLLKHKEKLALLGGGIFIDAQLQAFLIASALSKDTLEIHVEKADKDIRGLYIAMLKHFLMHQDEKYAYINREDDMGLEYLRQAKTNMKPVYKIKKYGIYAKKTHSRIANAFDKDQIMELWSESFQEETTATTNFYFDHLYHQEQCYVLVQGDEVLSMLQCRPMEMMVNGNKEHVSFLVGVATKKSYQRNGLMKELLVYVLSQLKTKEALTVLQAYDWNLYRPFGFKISHTRQCTHLQPVAYDSSYYVEETANAEALYNVYHTYCSSFNGYRIRDIKYYESYLLPYINMYDGKAFLVYDTTHTVVGSMIIQEGVCSEYLPLNEEANKEMLAYITKRYGDITIYAQASIPIPGNKEIVPCLMTLYHQEERLIEPLFINEVL